MNANVPAGAAILLDYIGALETGRQGDAAYETVIAHLNEKGALPKPITDMTLEELLAVQLGWVKELGQPSWAAGRYQIIRPTLLGLIEQYKGPLSSKFSPGLQDAFGYALLQRRGFDDFMAAKITLTTFGNELCREWTSLPLLSPVRRKIKGKTRTIPRGASYYDGDGINKSLDGAMDFQTVLADALNESDRAAPAPARPVDQFPTKGNMDNELAPVPLHTHATCLDPQQ